MIPAYLSVAEVAEDNEMSTLKCRRKLARAGILERDGKHRWHVAESRLRERLPEMYERVFEARMFKQPQKSTNEHGRA